MLPKSATRFLMICCTFASLAVAPSHAQNFRDFHDHNTEMKQIQPTWVAPLVTSQPLLGQFVREQFTRQIMPAGTSQWNIGNGKGPAYIMSSHVETDVAIPNYVVHGAGTGTDGTGDFSVTTKYRIVSGNSHHGNYVLSALGVQSWNTGEAKNGAISPTTGITLAGGKAFGMFSLISSLGATLPASSGVASIGRPIAFNTALEVHVSPMVWVEVENNSTFYHGGTHDGKKQSYMTPGAFLSPLKPWGEKSKSSILLGVGMQIAITEYRASNHNLIVDTKFVF